MRASRVLVPSLTSFAVVAALAAGAVPPPAGAATSPPVGAASETPRHETPRHEPPRQATAVGRGGAVSSVDPYASRVGLWVLRRGGNAVDAAVATAAALGVTEPYSSGLGGGGYFVYYDAASGRVRTLDGRETAPAGITPDAFLDPDTQEPWPFTPELVTSGVSVGVPGTPATWATAVHRWGSMDLGRLLRPAAALARRGFVVDDTFRLQTQENADRFRAFPASSRLFLPHGDAPAVGSVFRNPDLADTYDLLARRGVWPLYHGRMAREISDVVRHPRTTPDTDLPVPPGSMTPRDLAAYRVIERRPTHVRYRGYDVYGMPPSSSGGTTVGEALNILERYDLAALPAPEVQHLLIEAAHLAFADRAAYVGDQPGVPVRRLLADDYAAQRACLVDEIRAFTPPVAAGDVTAPSGSCAPPGPAGTQRPDTENLSTTNLTVADAAGNVVEYTLTIEQTGGSGMVLPGWGFLLNNELTDFTAVYDAADPNRIEPGKRPRSSMSPTIVLRGGRPALALGSPGGSTIITTVLQILVGRIDRGLTLPEAIAAPRVAPANRTPVAAEQAWIDTYGDPLTALGHAFTPAGAPGTSTAEIGAATGIDFGRGHLLTVAAEPSRRGGGAATVVDPAGYRR